MGRCFSLLQVGERDQIRIGIEIESQDDDIARLLDPGIGKDTRIEKEAIIGTVMGIGRKRSRKVGGRRTSPQPALEELRSAC